MDKTNQALNREVEKRTKEYHRQLKRLQSPDKLLEMLEWYVDNLLPLEMEQVRSRSPTPSSECHTLVLLVGYSLEPLLQSICFYQPHRIVLVLNKNYGREEGYVMGGHIEFLATRLEQTLVYQSQQPLLRRHPKLDPKKKEKGHFCSIEADPAQVFQLLLETLRTEQPENVVIDITGAKKSMVAGAFFYAAFANIAISYVEFNDEGYDLSLGRPEGYRSTIQQLSNPYTTFALREWSHFRSLYERYRFRDAYILLVGRDGIGGPGTIIDAARRYQPGAVPGIEQLAQVLKCYYYWDTGDFNQALIEIPDLAGFDPPTAVTQLGGQWFKVQGTAFSYIPPNLYDDTLDMRTYIYDELRRIERLIKYNQDFRSAFLRAGGVNEVLLVTRLVRMITDNSDKSILLETLNKHTPSARKLIHTLRRPNGEEIRVKRLFTRPPKPDISFQLTRRMKDWWVETPFTGTDGWDDFLEIRNNLAHTYLSIPRELAEAGYEFAKANFEDFLIATGDTITSLDIDTTRMKWPSLCALCGLNEYLTPNLLQ